MRRVLAVIGAVAMVAVAVVIRQAIDDDGSADGPDSDDTVVLACDTDLEAVCRAIEGVTVVVQDSADTAAALVAGERDDIDAWLTTDAWLAVAAGRTSRTLGEATVVARTDVAAAVVPERAGALGTLCADVPVVRCLGDHAGQPWGSLGGEPSWGQLRTGVPAADTALGLSVLGAIATSYFGDASFAANDFDPSGFRAWLAALTAASGAGDADPLRTLVGRPGTYSTALGTAAELDGITRPVEPLEVQPTVAVVAVLVDLAGGDEPPPPARVRDALTAIGWTSAEGSPAARYKTGVLGALHDLWKDVVR